MTDTLEKDLEDLHKLRCSKCHEYKNPQHFARNFSITRGYSYPCKACMKLAGATLPARNRLYLQQIETNGYEHELQKLKTQRARLDEKARILYTYKKASEAK